MCCPSACPISQCLTSTTYLPHSTKIFGFVGVEEDILATLAVGAVNVAMTIVSVFLIDRLGRKTLLLGGVVLMVVSLTALCFVLLMLNDSPGAQGNIAVAGVLVFVIGFAVGMGATSWVIIAEVLPSRVRSQAMSVAVALNWACNLVITQFSLSTIEALGGGSSDDQQKRGQSSSACCWFLCAKQPMSPVCIP